MNNKVAFNQFMDQEVLPLKLRPFVCSGHPLDCKVVVIGYNPATSKMEFSKFWNNETGFNKHEFNVDYIQTRGKFGGTRLRLNKLSESLSGKCVLETNVYWTPSKTPSDLDRKDRNSSHLIKLMQFLKPCAVIIHGSHANKVIEKQGLIKVWCDRGIKVYKVGHLSRISYTEIENIAEDINKLL